MNGIPLLMKRRPIFIRDEIDNPIPLYIYGIRPNISIVNRNDMILISNFVVCKIFQNLLPPLPKTYKPILFHADQYKAKYNPAGFSKLSMRRTYHLSYCIKRFVLSNSSYPIKFALNVKYPSQLPHLVSPSGRPLSSKYSQSKLPLNFFPPIRTSRGSTNASHISSQLSNWRQMPRVQTRKSLSK